MRLISGVETETLTKNLADADESWSWQVKVPELCKSHIEIAAITGDKDDATRGDIVFMDTLLTSYTEANGDLKSLVSFDFRYSTNG